MIILCVRLVDNRGFPITEYIFYTKGGDCSIVYYPIEQDNTSLSFNVILCKAYSFLTILIKKNSRSRNILVVLINAGKSPDIKDCFQHKYTIVRFLSITSVLTE